MMTILDMIAAFELVYCAVLFLRTARTGPGHGGRRVWRRSLAELALGLTSLGGIVVFFNWFARHDAGVFFSGAVLMGVAVVLAVLTRTSRSSYRETQLLASGRQALD